MNTILDPVFGEMSYQNGWIRAYHISFSGDDYCVQLFVQCGKASQIENAQRAAFLEFDKRREVLLSQASIELLKYYTRIYKGIRKRIGEDSADNVAPAVRVESELRKLVKPTHVYVKRTFGSEERVVGLLFDCSWNSSGGLAVKFVDEEIEEVGSQDIVL